MAAAVRRRGISRRNASTIRRGILMALAVDEVRELQSPLAMSLIQRRAANLTGVAIAAFWRTNNRLMMDRAFSDGEASE